MSNHGHNVLLSRLRRLAAKRETHAIEKTLHTQVFPPIMCSYLGRIEMCPRTNNFFYCHIIDDMLDNPGENANLD